VEEHMLRVFEDRVMRGIFGPKRVAFMKRLIFIISFCILKISVLSVSPEI
jgi:hypothetical protein